MMIDKKLLSVREAAGVLGCPVSKVYDLLHRGLLVGFKYEGSNAWYIPEESVRVFIAQRIYSNQTSGKNL